MQVRKAKLPDATNIYQLVNSLSGDGTLLRRGFAEICENVRDFTVAEPTKATSSAAARCTSTVRTSPRSAPSSSTPRPKVTVPVPNCWTRSSTKPKITASTPSASSPASPTFFLRHGFRIVEDRTALPDKIYQGLPELPAPLPMRRGRDGAWRNPQRLHPRPQARRETTRPARRLTQLQPPDHQHSFAIL